MLKYKRQIIVYCAFVLLVAFDMVTKIVTDEIDINVIDGVLSFSSVYNKGAAWSMFSNYTFILAVASLAFVCIAVIFDCKTKLNKTKLYNVAYVFILAGAFGNAIDRTFLGYVRDFIKLDFINFPVFNVADSLLVVGVILLAFYIIFHKESKEISDKDKVSGNDESELNVVYINKQDTSKEAVKMASAKMKLMQQENKEKEKDYSENKVGE